MKVYTYSKARQQFAEVLNRAGREGAVEIRRRDGQVFTISPAVSEASPLDVACVRTNLSRQDIVGLVRASRRSTERLLPKRRGR